MKNLRKSWKVITLVALAAILILGYAVRSRAFTLIEQQESFFLPYIFSPNAIGEVKVTNISDVTLTVTIAVFNDGGTIVQTGTPMTVLPGQTITFALLKQATAVSLRPVVVISGGHNFNGSLAELLVFNANNQIIAALPAVQLGI